jgi:hypothetical protein
VAGPFVPASRGGWPAPGEAHAAAPTAPAAMLAELAVLINHRRVPVVATAVDLLLPLRCPRGALPHGLRTRAASAALRQASRPACAACGRLRLRQLPRDLRTRRHSPAAQPRQGRRDPPCRWRPRGSAAARAALAGHHSKASVGAAAHICKEPRGRGWRTSRGRAPPPKRTQCAGSTPDVRCQRPPAGRSRAASRSTVSLMPPGVNWMIPRLAEGGRRPCRGAHTALGVPPARVASGGSAAPVRPHRAPGAGPPVLAPGA